MRLIDASALDTVPWEDKWDAVKAINNAPAVDAVEVVRCKDCKHWLDYGVCNRHITYPALWMEINDFCSYGERRNDG